MYKLQYLFDDYDNFSSDKTWEEFDDVLAARSRAYKALEGKSVVIMIVEIEDEETETD